MSSGTPAKRPDARVAIVYSESKDQSNDSKNLAFYFACCLAHTGYASIFLVPCAPDGSSSDDLPTLRRLSFVPPGSSRAVDVAVRYLRPKLLFVYNQTSTYISNSYHSILIYHTYTDFQYNIFSLDDP